MTPYEYGAALKWIKLTSPAYSALRGAGVGAALGAPVGVYRYATKDDASWKDAVAPSLAGAALGGTLGGVAQHVKNMPVYQQYTDQMRDWEITRGARIFQDAHAGAVQGGAAHPFSEASQQLASMRDRRSKVVRDALTQAHGDRDIFKLKTHTGS